MKEENIEKKGKREKRDRQEEGLSDAGLTIGKGVCVYK